MAEIDVLIPVYNAAATVEAAVMSILNQDATDFRLIVIDDGSTDGSTQILQAIAERHPNMVLLQQKNQGAVAALNLGLKACDAPLVARLDHDDISDPHRFRVQKAFLDAHPECVAVSGAVRHIAPDGTLLRENVSSPSPDLADPRWAPAKEPYVLQPFFMGRREALQALGGFRPIHYAEDTDLCWRLTQFGRLVNMPDLVGSYRIHPGSMSGSLMGGRVMAVHSQLSAISEQRRRKGAEDIVIENVTVSHYRKDRSLGEIYANAAAQLTKDEADWLKVATAAKILELSSFRPFELTAQDAAFIASAWPLRRVLTAENQKELLDRYLNAIWRLAKKGLYREAVLLQPALAPRSLIRALRRALRTARGAPAPAPASSA